MAFGERASRRVRFGLAALLFLTLCACGYLGGYRSGYDAGRDDSRSSELVAVAYSVSDLIAPRDGPDTPDRRQQAGDRLIALVKRSIEPDSHGARAAPARARSRGSSRTRASWSRRRGACRTRSPSCSSSYANRRRSRPSRNRATIAPCPNASSASRLLQPRQRLQQADRLLDAAHLLSKLVRLDELRDANGVAAAAAARLAPRGRPGPRAAPFDAAPLLDARLDFLTIAALTLLTCAGDTSIPLRFSSALITVGPASGRCCIMARMAALLLLARLPRGPLVAFFLAVGMA